MMRYLLIMLMSLCLNSFSWAVNAEISLDKAPINLNDTASIRRGANFFAAHCLTCHSLVYAQHDAIAQRAGITYDKAKAWPDGATPSDLSLIASARSPDWVYTYLHSFYIDPTRPTGVNNLLVPNTLMPGIMMSYQGQQFLAKDLAASRHEYNHRSQWYDLLVLQKQGSMSPQEFDATLTDVVNFLTYVAEPYHKYQAALGYWVLSILFIFVVFAFLLKKACWKDVKK